MADLKFVDQHNMVAYLEKTEENIEFHQIVDFLSTCSIKYALTVSPTIYASYIEHFWNTATSKIVNSVKQIHAIVDGKDMVISESSVRSDLLFNDEDSIACLTNDEIFENLALMGYEQLSTKLTFQKVRGDIVERAITTAARLVATQDSDNILKTQSTAMSNDPLSQEISSGGSPRRQETMGGSLAQTRSERVLEKPNEPPLPEGHTSGSGEGSMEHTFELMDTIPPTPYDSPLTGGYTPGSDEGRLKLKELMAICTKLSKQVLDLEKEKDAQAVEILKLKQRVKKLERKRKSSISHPRRRIYRQVESSDDDLDEEDASKQGRESDKTKSIATSYYYWCIISTAKLGDKTKPMFNDSDFDELNDAVENVEGGSTAQQITTAGDTLNTTSINVSTVGPSNVSAAGPSTSTAGDIFEDEMTTIVDTLVAIRSARPRTTSVVIRDVEEEPRRATPVPIVQSQDNGKGKMVEPEPTPKNPIKAPIARDAEIAQRLFEEEQAQFEKEQRIVREKATEQEAKDAALIDQMEDVQARIDADALLAARLQEQEREQFSIDEQARFLVETIAERKRFFVA
ncbi:hypothetical protein Tco_1238520 [Tanacetum coccineum]